MIFETSEEKRTREGRFQLPPVCPFQAFAACKGGRCALFEYESPDSSRGFCGLTQGKSEERPATR